MLPPKAALERLGLHQATIRGRFVAPDGAPVPDVIVQLKGGRRFSLPYASTRSDADGRFVLADVDCPYFPELRWFPPQHLSGYRAVGTQSGEDSDFGNMVLQPDTVIRVQMEMVGGLPLAPNSAYLSLRSAEQDGPRAEAAAVGQGQWLVRQITFTEGNWQVSLYPPGGPWQQFTARASIRRGSRDQVVRLRVLRDEGRMEVAESTASPAAVSREVVIRGRTLTVSGRPRAGLVAYIAPSAFFGPFHWSVTDAAGGYLLRTTLDACSVFGQYAGWAAWIVNWSCADLPKEPFEERMNFGAPLLLVPRGVEPSAVRASWWHNSLQWLPTGTLEPSVVIDTLEPLRIRMEADGYLPVVKILSSPSWVPGRDPTPTLSPVEFPFDEEATRELVIEGGGDPHPGAVVDVDQITDLAKDQRQALQSYRVPMGKPLVLKGGRNALVEVFVYAKGFEPTRAIWNTGTRLTVNLVRRNATLSFLSKPSATVARIREVNAPYGVRTLWLNEPAAAIQVAPGTYDITTYDKLGKVLGYRRELVKSEQIATIDPAEDQRPRLIVRYPGFGCTPRVWESTPSGFPVNWTSIGFDAGTLRLGDIPATQVSATVGETVFLLSRAGKVHVELGRQMASIRLWREVEARPGATVTLTLGEESGTLRGGMATFVDALRGSAHGYAGPRLQMISTNGWSATVYIPGDEGKGAFTLRDLPPGQYVLYQHLVGEPKSYEFQGQTRPYTGARDAWGGIPVTISAGEATQLRDFSEYPPRPLVVTVRTPAGKNVENATVRIKDRMSDAWRVYEEDPAQVRSVALGIPYPPATRLSNGLVTLPNVRVGTIELMVELDNGPIYTFVAPVGNDGHVTLTLPI